MPVMLTSIFVNSHSMASDWKKPSPVITTVLQSPLQVSCVLFSGIEGACAAGIEQSGPRNCALHMHIPMDTKINVWFFIKNVIFG